VVESLDDEQEFQNELSRLVNSFGIGIIKLDKQNASNSVVVYEAQKRKNLDFEMIDKLAKLNPDFQAFLETIEIDAQGKRVNRQYYDAVMELE
jgi:hypothetical protein